MSGAEKLLFVLGCYAQALIINMLAIKMLDGLNLLVWILYNIWMWCFVPIIIIKYGDKL